MCEFFKKPDRDPVLKTLIESLNQYGHMLLSCPVKKGNYYLKDFILEASYLPSFTPLGDYRLEFFVTFKRKENSNHKLLYKMTWYATIIDEKSN